MNIKPNIVGTVNKADVPYVPQDCEGAFILESSHLNNYDEGCYKFDTEGNLMYHGIFRQWTYSQIYRQKEFLRDNRFLSIIN